MAFKRFLLAPALMLSLSASSGNVPYEPGVIRFAPIALDRDRPERRDFDELTLLGAWSLTSDNPDFGGISAIQVKDDRITAINDDGKMFRFPLADSSPNSRLQSRLLPALKRVIDLHADSESLAIDPDTGMVWVGFEATNTIQRFTPDMRGRTRWTAPRQMRGWPKNAGAEALVRMRDGRFLVFSERSAGPRGTEALLFTGDPTLPRQSAIRFYYKAPRGYFPTDAAQLPDGRIMVLNRRISLFDPIGAALVTIDPREIVRDKVLRRQALIRIEPPLSIDNMEALSITESNGRTILWLASDDNFSLFQRTLLLKFELKQSAEAIPSERDS